MFEIEWGAVVALAVGIGAVAGAIKGLPVFWSFLKAVGRFFSGFERISRIPTVIENQHAVSDKIDNALGAIGSVAIDVVALSNDLKTHMAEEEAMRMEEKTLVEELVQIVRQMAITSDKQAIEVAEAVFRQAVFADHVAYYIIDWDEESGQWLWKWGNSAYLNLTGLTPNQAAGGQYWDIIATDEKDRVHAAANYAGENGIALEVDFTCVNMLTNEETPVRVLAAPLRNRDEKTVGYLGSIHKKSELPREA